MTKPKHGGKREGAGRKRLPPKKKLCIPLDDVTFDQLRLMCKCHGVSQAIKVSELINRDATMDRLYMEYLEHNNTKK